mgnify:FL=1
MIKNFDDLRNICTQLPIEGKYIIECNEEQYKVIVDFLNQQRSPSTLICGAEFDTTDYCGIKILGFEFIIKKTGYLDSMNFNLKKPMNYYIEKI